MDFAFSKYHAIGNDFIMIDKREDLIQLSSIQRRHICSRKHGIGADGLIEIKSSNACDFEFKYYNNDGEVGSLCGNGARCALHFAKYIGMIDGSSPVTFRSCDGVHHGGFSFLTGIPYIMFNQVCNVVKYDIDNFYVFTGSPHHIQFVSDIQNINIQTEGRAIAHGPLYGADGSNVNFVETVSQTCAHIRTYERGIEDETLACGTGSVAGAIASWTKYQDDESYSRSTIEIFLNFQFGTLTVCFKVMDGIFTNIKLQGPVQHVFNGTFSLEKE